MGVGSDSASPVDVCSPGPLAAYSLTRPADDSVLFEFEGEATVLDHVVDAFEGVLSLDVAGTTVRYPLTAAGPLGVTIGEVLEVNLYSTGSSTLPGSAAILRHLPNPGEAQGALVGSFWHCFACGGSGGEFTMEAYVGSGCPPQTDACGEWAAYNYQFSVNNGPLRYVTPGTEVSTDGLLVRNGSDSRFYATLLPQCGAQPYPFLSGLVLPL